MYKEILQDFSCVLVIDINEERINLIYLYIIFRRGIQFSAMVIVLHLAI